MGSMSPGTMVLTGLLIALYGVLVGGTWVRRQPERMWDTVSTIIFIVVAAVATIHLVIVGARQAAAFEKAKDRLNCVSIQLDAIRADLQTPMDAPLTIPNCDVHW